MGYVLVGAAWGCWVCDVATSCAAVWPADVVDSTASRIHTAAVNHTVAVAADTCLVPQCRIEPCAEVGMGSSTVAVGSGPGRA